MPPAERLTWPSPPAELLPWDSEFWGVRIGRVLDAERLDEVDAWVDENGVACVYLRTEDEPEAVHAALAAGFELVEPRLTLTLRRGGARLSSELRVRDQQPGDLPALRELARRTRYVSRFAFDPRFAPRAPEYFEAWIGFADAVLVVEQDGEIRGYITCRLPESGVDSSFGIVAVDDTSRERGVGTALLQHGSEWLFDRGMETVSVAIAARNIATLR